MNSPTKSSRKWVENMRATYEQREGTKGKMISEYSQDTRNSLQAPHFPPKGKIFFHKIKYPPWKKPSPRKGYAKVKNSEA